jgi:hypothetical protein
MTMTPLAARALAALGTWGRPPDAPAKIAAAAAALLALLALAGRGRTLLGAGVEEPSPAERRRTLFAIAFVAALLSLGYVAVYLRGGPRIIDATTYFLQGRALARGDFAWDVLEPSASFRGRFLSFRPSAGTLGGIFPPGYPLLLSFGFMLGAPMIVGPLLAGALVVATYRLARTLAEDTPLAADAPAIGRGAALLSLLCAALRYHTADTMSHGAAALGVTVALTAALEARRAAARGQTGDDGGHPLDAGRGFALLAGLALGYVLATRPVSLLPVGAVSLVLVRRPARLVGWLAAGVLPGLLLLLLSQREVTGHWFTSTQRLYYAVSDGPPGCFRWGFGAHVGCLFEHGDFVHARLEHGFGVAQAAATTLRRLHHHLLDVANLEPLALLVLVPIAGRLRRRPAIIAATALVAGQVLAYAPFYFDGDYPGGGARFFADVLPIEHALVVVGVAALAARAGRTGTTALVRGVLALLALAAAGFAVHASFEHGKLRDRDGGRPMFERDVLAAAGVTHGVVFVETDHGFAIGHDPNARPEQDVVVVRLRSDDRDRMVYDALGKPPSYSYKFDAKGLAPPSVLPWVPPEHSYNLRFEAEAEWPALWQEGGFAAPAWAGGCASGGRVLTVTPTSDGRRARAAIALPVPSAGRWSVEPHVASNVSVPFAPAGPGPVEGVIDVAGSRWSWKPASSCETLFARTLELIPPVAVLTIEASGGPVSLDHVVLRKL